MKKYLAILGILAACAGLSACAEERAATLPPGQYESTHVSTDANGTEYKNTSKTDVTEDRYGNKKVTVHKKTTRDPKGLFNKETTRETTKEIDTTR